MISQVYVFLLSIDLLDSCVTQFLDFYMCRHTYTCITHYIMMFMTSLSYEIMVIMLHYHVIML